MPATHLNRIAASALLAAALLVSAASQISAQTPQPKPAPQPTYLPSWCSQPLRPQFARLARVPVASTWFQVYKPAPGVFAIYEPRQSEETIGYLILGTRRALLFDTGMGIGNLRALTAQLTRLPIIVLNSHTHNDHVGGNYQFPTIYGMDTAFTRRSALGSIKDAQAEIAPGQVCGPLPAGFNPATYSTRPWRIARFMHNGDQIPLGGRTLQIIATPGHTPDAICLFDPAHGLLFTGDTYYTGTIWLYRPETNLAAYQQSVQKLAALAPRVKLVLGAHNVPTATPSVLTQLNAAFIKVQSGKVQPQPAGPGKVTYKVGDISFLMRPR